MTFGYTNRIKFKNSDEYAKNGQEILNNCKNTLTNLGISIPIGQKNNDDNKESKESGFKDSSIRSQKEYITNNKLSKNIFSIANSANRAFAKAASMENSYIKGIPQDSNSETLLSTSRLIETMETIEEAGKRHLSFLSEDAPESGNISGGVDVYYEKGTNTSTTAFLGSVENRWQNQKKNIYTKLEANLGRDTSSSQKIVGNIAMDGRLDKKDMIYGAGVEYSSFSNSTQILDVHVAAKHKKLGIGADLNRRTTFSKDESTGEHIVVGNMKLTVDLLSNKNEDNMSSAESYTPFSFDTESSALPSEAVAADTEAKTDAAQYLIPDRKDGFDIDFNYNENECGFIANYNKNFYEKQNKILSVAPIVGLHYHTDSAQETKNESLKMTCGIVAQAGKQWSDGQTFKGSITAIGNRIVKTGSHPFDSGYVLANLQYSNPKAKLNTEIDAGIVNSGEAKLKYINLIAEKQMKNSSIGINSGISRFNVTGESENLFSIMATYKYNLSYKTKK